VAASEKLRSEVIVMAVDARHRLKAFSKLDVERLSDGWNGENQTGMANTVPARAEEIYIDVRDCHGEDSIATHNVVGIRDRKEDGRSSSMSESNERDSR
jgi:hypothetical protein